MNLTKKTLFLAVLLLFFPIYANSISANNAVSFVTQENHFLFEDEDYQLPVVEITHEGKKYWVIPILSGNTLVTFFPVKSEAKELSLSKPLNRQLFKTADTLRSLSVEKERISKNQQVDWLFASNYVLIFEELSRGLENEIFEMNIIESTLNNADVSSQVNRMNSSLSTMSLKSGGLTQSITEAIAAEAAFASAPDALSAAKLKDEFDDAFEELFSLNADALSYRDEIQKLKQLISVSDADAATKDYLVSLADPPAEFNNIGRYVTNALSLQQAINGMYANVDSRADSLLAEFESRVERDKAFRLLYSENTSISRRTEGEFSSLQQIVNFILDENNRPYWKNKELISAMESKWSQAVRNFNERNYALAETFAEKAADDAVAIFNQGFIEAAQPPLLPQELIFQLVIALLALLAILYLYNNRGKIIKFVKQGSEEEEVELSAWKDKP
ncbi:MAG TPA: hypothetical protein HA237_05330 [Candidatus Diapherotrites archaeon]|uniref:Uncharacterized protein n=1 Tax=Candidatus Iainarchaeum sp. TaxID=3101447 RepID=A0A7J4IWV0_9ARCH|nr:hypothetical protein [Candidatus Diapherotrites archaeon]